MEDLPDDLCCQVALFLHVPDILALACSSTRFREQIGESRTVWHLLFSRDTDTALPPTTSAGESSSVQSSTVPAGLSVGAIKQKVLTVAYSNDLSTIRWCPVLSQDHNGGRRPDAREGHLMTILGQSDDRQIVTTGGYCDDHCVYTLSVQPAQGMQRDWTGHAPRGGEPSFVYGASLTALDENQAVRFGGFRAGGYSGETNEVCLLTMSVDENQRRSFRWETKAVAGTKVPRARAYHTATLLQSRYLLIVGGMTASGSILHEAILDTQTWTWIENSLSGENKPSGRHGHSTVLDQRRNRLVLFGGGSGSDLLRSGTDMTTVWQLEFGSDFKSDLVASLPWTWQMLYKNQNEETNSDENDSTSEVPVSELMPSECLVLGRCHVGLRVTLDTVLLAFGSGHPSTNGVLGYDLRTDSFVRPTMRLRPLPRFTAAAAVLENEGYVVVHGGYSTQEGGTLDDTVVFDLAPDLNRQFPGLDMAPDGERNIPFHRPVDDDDVRHLPTLDMDEVRLRLSAAAPEDRQMIANQIIREGVANGTLDLRGAMILSMFGNGMAYRYGWLEEDDSS